jgi:hypothetical protein
MSSKAVLSMLETTVREAENLPIVFHMDCTFKGYLNECPVLVFGMSNAQQQFHLLSMSVISHHLQEIYDNMLSNFKQLILMYTKLETNDSYVVDYLGDTCTC